MRTHNIYNGRPINNNLVKDGYIYLFRGDSSGDTYFKSRKYDKGIKLSDVKEPLDLIAKYHTEEFPTPFISLTSSVLAASMYSNMTKIYLVKIPVKDIYIYRNEISTLEEEYLVADYISKEEIVKIFEFDQIKDIYEYLLGTIKLNIVPRDIGVPYDDINELKIMDIYKLTSKFICKYHSESELYGQYIEKLSMRNRGKIDKKSDYSIDRTHDLYEDRMIINPNLVHDGYIYLFKEYEPGDENGIQTPFYLCGKKVKDFGQNPFILTGLSHQLGMSPFIDLTSSIIQASCDSHYSKIILFRIPLNDILTFNSCSIMNDFRYLVPDQISKDEIVGIFNDTDIKTIYKYMVETIGLNISPRDIDIETDYIEMFSEDKLKELKQRLDEQENQFMKILGL
jgi:hypothetical protein